MKRRRASIFTKLVIIAIVLYTGTTLVSLNAQINDAKLEKERLQQEYVDRTLAIADMQYAIDHSDEDKTIEDIAREKLGLVKPGERIFYDTGD